MIWAIMIFSRNQRHTAVFFKVFFREIYTTGSLLDWEPEDRSLEAFPIGTKNSWNERILSLSYSFDIQMVVITIYYILTHVNVFSPETLVVVLEYIFGHFIYDDITFWCRRHKHHFGNGRKIFLFLVPHLFKKWLVMMFTFEPLHFWLGKKLFFSNSRLDLSLK